LVVNVENRASFCVFSRHLLGGGHPRPTSWCMAQIRSKISEQRINSSASFVVGINGINYTLPSCYSSPVSRRGGSWSGHNIYHRTPEDLHHRVFLLKKPTVNLKLYGLERNKYAVAFLPRATDGFLFDKCCLKCFFMWQM